MFSVVFDYGEHDPMNPTPTDSAPWLCRQDPFSSFRSGFDIRTYRLCRRILMFHQFPNELGKTKLSRLVYKFGISRKSHRYVSQLCNSYGLLVYCNRLLE